MVIASIAIYDYDRKGRWKVEGGRGAYRK